MQTRDGSSADLVDRLAPSGPPAGFSKGINDSLIAASSLAHLKAAGILGFALTLTGLLLSDRPSDAAAWYCHFAGIALLVVSAACGALVIFPREAVRPGGKVFWGDIATHGTADAYVASLASLSASDAEAEYAATNFHFSRVLAAKFGWVRWSVACLMAGCLLAVIARFFA